MQVQSDLWLILLEVKLNSSTEICSLLIVVGVSLYVMLIKPTKILFSYKIHILQAIQDLTAHPATLQKQLATVKKAMPCVCSVQHSQERPSHLLSRTKYLMLFALSNLLILRVSSTMLPLKITSTTM